MVTLFKYPTKDSTLANEFGKFIIEKQNECLSDPTKEFFNIGIGQDNKDTDTIILNLQQCLINNSEISNAVKWPQWKIYFVNENLVSIHNNGSNYHEFETQIVNRLIHKDGHYKLGPTLFTINESLLVKEGHDLKNIDKMKIAKEYSDILPAKFDLLILNCQTDGDTCSLKQNMVTNFTDDDRIFIDKQKMSISLDMIKQSHQICFFIGEEGPISKKQIAHEIFLEESSNHVCTSINKSCSNKVTWFVNEKCFT